MLACHERILDTSRTSTAESSAARWGQELGLTRVINQDLPLIYGANSLELVHVSGVKISFCALDALRAWALLDLPPVPHRVKGPLLEWDYTSRFWVEKSAWKRRKNMSLFLAQSTF